jgi:hypothetical protein
VAGAGGGGAGPDVAGTIITGTDDAFAVVPFIINSQYKIMDFTKHLALRIKLHKIHGSVVQHAALLKKGLEMKGIQCNLVKGYCVIPETKEACAHYWVQTVPEGLDLDIGYEVAKLRSPELEALHTILLDELPPGFERSDADALEITRENERLFDLYHTNPKAFWKEAPSFKF